ncbi:MAG: ATP-dependent protease ATPase subunit HslU [Pirellulales bacterium]
MSELDADGPVSDGMEGDGGSRDGGSRDGGSRDGGAGEAGLESRGSGTPVLTPREIVAALDRHIIGQQAAKRAVAVAVRNRWRRQQLSDDLRRDIHPKNILMIGPTGVGKTEIARRLARLTGAPFIKVEATKYTEVGYYGRDVESMIRELVENGIQLVRATERGRVQEQAASRAEERLLDLLVPPPPMTPGFSAGGTSGSASDDDTHAHHQRARQRMRDMLTAGQLEQREVELKVEQKSAPVLLGGIGGEHLDFELQGMLEKMIPKATQRRRVTVSEARQIIFDQECDALLDPEKIHAAAIQLAENSGIVFIDEMDKVVASETRGADVSRQGVQRDLLPIVEGTTIQTKYGAVRTDHVLFVAAGAFHRSKPSDLMPELQGRFPIRVELTDLSQEDFVRILTEPDTALTRQYSALLETEGVALEFTPDAITTLAEFAFRVNQQTQNIGARRLYTMMEHLLEELSFEAPESAGRKVQIDAAYVRQRLSAVAADEDVSRYIL